MTKLQYLRLLFEPVASPCTVRPKVFGRGGQKVES